MVEINTVYNEDIRTLLPKIDSESIDLVVSDVPYKVIAGGVRIVYEDDENQIDYSKTDPQGCLGRGRIFVKSDGTACSNKWLKKGQSDIPSAVKDGKMFEHNDIKFNEYLSELYRVLKKGTHCYLMINARNLADLQNEAEKAGFEFQNLLIWHKNNATPNKYFMQQAEFILMLSKRPARNINDMGTSNILKFPNIIGTKLHPSQKPQKLMEVMIKQSSKTGDIILDPFAGSGQTLKAAKALNRNFIGCEIDEKFYFIIQNELKNVQGALF